MLQTTPGILCIYYRDEVNPLIPHPLHAASYSLHPEPYTLHPTPDTLHPTPYTLHPTPLHPYTLLPPTLTLLCRDPMRVRLWIVRQPDGPCIYTAMRSFSKLTRVYHEKRFSTYGSSGILLATCGVPCIYYGDEVIFSSRLTFVYHEPKLVKVSIVC